MASFVRAGRTKPNFFFLSSTINKAGQQFRADVFKIPQQRQALLVGSNTV